MGHFTRAIALLALASWMLSPVALAAQGSAPVVHIVGLDTAQFPSLTLRLNYTSVAGEPVADAPTFAVSVNDTPMPDLQVATERREIAVAVVADLSAHMSDKGTGFSTRFDDMLPRVKELVDLLREGGHFASLVTFGAEVRTFHDLTYDLGAVSNTLNRGDSDRLFEPAPLDGADAAAPYPLAAAIAEGLDQLEAADESAPLAMVLFAAGDPAPQDLVAIRARLEESRAAGRPVQLLIVGFGSGEQGSFTTFPAGLAGVADELGGRLVEVGVQPLGEERRREIEQAFARVDDLANQYAVTFSASAVDPGEATIAVTAGEASDSIAFDPGVIPPRFNVVVDTRAFQEEARLAIAVEFQQAPISRVEYLLNGLPLATSRQGPDFAQTISVYDTTFQQQFPPGAYELTAAAFDANGNESRSKEPIPVTVFAPPPPPPLLERLLPYWWVGLIIIALVGLAAYGFMRRPAPTRRRPISETAPTGVSPIEEPTVEHGATSGYSATQAYKGPDLTTEFHPGGVTTEFQPARSPKTQRLRMRWVIEVLEGDPDAGRRFELSEDRYFNIGRANPPDTPPEFVLSSTLISKGSHARLSLLHDGIELTAGASRNGTFVGEEQREVPPQSRHILKEHDIFWLSRGVKLRVRQEDVL